MKPHQTIALALRVARTCGSAVKVTPHLGTLRFAVSSPADVRTVRALTDAGFVAVCEPRTGFAGWVSDCMVPGYRATEFLLSLDGDGPLPEPLRSLRAARPARKRPRGASTAASTTAPAAPTTPTAHTGEGPPGVTVLRANRVRRAA